MAQGQTIAIDDVTVVEGDTGTVEATFTVTRSGITPLQVTVDYATADGTALAADGDYRPTSGTLTFMGTRPETITVVIEGDTKREPDETFFVNLSNPQNATITNGQGQGTILDDDPLPMLSISDVMLPEGNVGTTDFSFNVTLSAESCEPVTVSYATADGTATAADNDYEPITGMLTFQPGESTIPVTVSVNGDVRVEEDETFFVNLQNPDNAAIADGRATGTILNDDERPMLSISDALDVVEGDSGTRDATFDVTLSAVSNEVVTVSYATADGTAAAADSDYAPDSDTLTFQPGETTQTIAIPVNGDTRVEPDETFFVDLSGVVNGEIDVGRGTVTIVDDDPGQLQFTSAPSVLESTGVAVVTVERVEADDVAARVTVVADTGTATAGEDFTAVSQVLEWGPGEIGLRQVEVPILDDNLQEDDETIDLRLSDPIGAILGAPAAVELVIVDDDTPMELEPDGEPELTGEANQEIKLTVLALRSDGQPLAGVAVAWQLAEGDAELLDGDTTLTDADGVATQRVRLGATPGMVVVTAQIQDTEDAVSFEIEIEGALTDIPPAMLSPGEAALVEVLDESCAAATGDFSEACDYLFQLSDPADQAKVVEELTPEEASAQGTVSQTSPKVQVGNIGSRLAALRGGAAGLLAVDQLAFDFRGKSLGVGRVRAGLAKYSQEREWLAASLDRAMAAEQQGGGGGSGDAQGNERDAADSRLGFFITGKISIGDRPTSAREEGFDFETLGLTAGVDYSFTNRLIGGVAIGYLDTATDIVDDGGKLDAQGYSLSTYGTYYAGDFYLEGVLSYGRNDYDQVRNIDLPQPFQGQSRYVARGSAEGRQLSLNLGAGYEAAFGATTIIGKASVSWTDVEIDGFAEQGAGPFNLRLGDQALESLESQARLDLTRAITVTSWRMVLHPVLGLAYLHEFENDSRVIRGSFVEDQTGNTFDVPTDAPDRDYFRLSAGFTFAFIRGRTAFLLYDRDLDRDDLNVYTISLGLRLGL